MIDTTASGLRDRKRLETRRRLERAAVELALAHGPENVTVEEISAAADVSPRTFFNYFDSKEDALLGLPPSEQREQTIEAEAEAVDAPTLLDGVLRLLLGLIDGKDHDPELREKRHALARTNPELFHRHATRMSGMIASMSRAIHILARRTGVSCTDAQAQVILFACGSALRAMLVDAATTLPVTTPATDAARETLLRNAHELVTESIGKLS